MGWAATSGATEADADILKNITEAKEVFAVWKDNKAPVIDNIETRQLSRDSQSQRLLLQLMILLLLLRLKISTTGVWVFEWKK